MRSYIILGIVFIVTALTMLLIPAGFIRAVVVSLGVAAIVNGVYNLMKFRNLVDNPLFRRVITIRAITSIAVGLLAVTLPLVLAGTLWFLVSYLLAFYLLAATALELYGIVKMREAGLPVTVYIYEAAVSVFIAMVLLFIPGTTGLLLVRICGALIFIGGAGCIAYGAGVLKKF